MKIENIAALITDIVCKSPDDQESVQEALVSELKELKPDGMLLAAIGKLAGRLWELEE